MVHYYGFEPIGFLRFSHPLNNSIQIDDPA
jgi:hypothetical protein